MLRFIKRHPLLLSPLFFIVAVLWFYGSYEITAKKAAADIGLTEQQSDSIKHAYAAAQIYTLFTHIGMSPDTAKETLLSLGKFNEYFEKYLKLWHPDWTRGIIKDLSNNLLGIEAIQRLGETAAQLSSEDRLCLVTALAKNGTLMRAPDEVPLTRNEEALKDSLSDVTAAIKWFDFHRPEISERFEYPRDTVTRFKCGAVTL